VVVAKGLNVPTPDDDGREGADELQEPESVVCYEEGETAGAVGAVEGRFFDHC